jgi:hypothetical protein
MIPIKGYSTFDPLKHCVIGKNFSSDFFEHNIKDTKISDPLRRIADETEEDYQTLDKILKDAGVQTYRIDFDETTYDNNFHGRPPVCPRDHFATIGETFYATHPTDFYGSMLKQIDRNKIFLKNWDYQHCLASTAFISRCGKDLFWDRTVQDTRRPYNNKNGKDECAKNIATLKEKWTNEGFRVHESSNGYHSDGAFCIVRPGCIVTLNDVQDYAKEFPGWDVLCLPVQSWSKVDPFLQMKDKVGGRWWVEGEEHNDQLIEFVNTWLKDWVGYVEETVFDVNMLSIDQNTVICNNYNKEVFDHFKKHKVEPIIFNFRHRYFWDGGVHCITQDLYREGTMEDYM